MKIMHVIAGAAQGGAETFMLEAALALAETPGVEQHVVIRPDHTDRIARLRAAGIGVETAGFSRLWRAPTRRTIRRAIDSVRPDVIQYWMGRAGEFAPPEHAARQIGWYGGYYKARRFVNCDWRIGVSEDLGRHIGEQGVPPERVGVIHLTVDLDLSAPADRAALDTPPDAPVALALARLHEKKGLDVLLKTLAELPEWHAWIAGEGPLEADLKAQAAQLGVADRAHFLGWRTDRGALLAACDVVTFPSRYEPFGAVMVEAWAAEKPLVAADAAGPAAYVADGENGLLIPKDDVDALTAALTRLRAEPALAARLVAGGRETYAARFSKEAFVRESLAFYEKIAAAQRP